MIRREWSSAPPPSSKTSTSEDNAASAGDLSTERRHPLLEPLNAEQQRLVDVVAEAFLAEEYRWPYFDYVEGALDDEGLDAIEVLGSFPSIGRWGYGAVSWNRNNSP